MKKLFLFSWALCFIGAGVVLADVIPVSPGTDQISAALTGAYPDDILELAEGDYTETDTLVTTVDITIRGAAGATVTWYVADTIDAIHAQGNLHVENIIFKTDLDTVSAWVFENDTISATHNDNVAITNRSETATLNNIFVDHCQFIGFGAGIYLRSDDQSVATTLDTLKVTNSLFYGGGKWLMEYGIYAYYERTKAVIVQKSTFWNIEGEACYIRGAEDGGAADPYDVLIEFCTFSDMGYPDYSSGYPGIHPTANGVGAYARGISDDDTLRNNIFYDICDFAINSRDNAFATAYFDYNSSDTVGWGCGTCEDWHRRIRDLVGPNSIIQDGGLKFADPDNGNFTLGTGSIAIGNASDGSDRGNPVVIWHPGTWDHTVGVEVTPVPEAFALRQNYPNPFNPTTRITYSILEGAPVKLDIYDILGRKVRTLVNEVQNPNTYTRVWDGLDDRGGLVSGGVYFYRLQTGSSVETRKMVLLK